MRYLSVLLIALASLAVAQEDYSGLKARFEKAFPRATVTGVHPSPVPGLVEVEINGNEVVYATPDGGYMLSGSMLQIQANGRLVDLGEQRLEGIRKAGLSTLDMKDTITFPAGNEKAEVFVFTDVTCGYCRRFHQHMDEYNARGITVHYLAFPRAGVDGDVADTMRAVWCAADRRQALTDAKLKNLQATPPANCPDLVSEQYELGLAFGVRGTPAVYARSGGYLGGYISPEELAAGLGLASPAK